MEEVKQAANEQGITVLVNPEIGWKTVSGRECLFFKFDAFLTAENAKQAVEKWKLEFRKASGRKICVVWDCLLMKNYDKQARVIWQDAIKELTEQIECIWIITNSPFIGVGASVIGTLTKLNIYTAKSVKEIKLKAS